MIVDDHAIVRWGLRELLKQNEDFKVIADVGNGVDALTILRSQHCDVMLLDMTMPEKHGLELLTDFLHEFPKLRILVLSMHSVEQFGVRALKMGAAGYMTKDSDPKLISIAIHKIASGKKYIPPELAELLEFQLHRKSDKLLHETLSSRELAVFLCIVNGKSVTEIAKELSLSVKTVSNYRVRALTKMNMKTNAEIFHYAHHTGLII
jgi:DNA-binding NarL/FixJ family response regulator